MLVLLGVKKGDDRKDLAYVVKKVSGLRIISDRNDKMNLSVNDPDVKGEILAVSQFTLLGDVRKGRRPSFDSAEGPRQAEEMFDEFTEALRALDIPVQTGVFGAMMQVSLVNDGPVTLIVDSEAIR